MESIRMLDVSAMLLEEESLLTFNLVYMIIRNSRLSIALGVHKTCSRRKSLKHLWSQELKITKPSVWSNSHAKVILSSIVVYPAEKTPWISSTYHFITSGIMSLTVMFPYLLVLQKLFMNTEWTTSVALCACIQAAFPQVMSHQVADAWTKMSQMHWQWNGDQVQSLLQLLAEMGDEVKVFHPKGIPEGVEMIYFGFKKKVAMHLKGKVIEIAMDATCRFMSATKGIGYSLKGNR